MDKQDPECNLINGTRHDLSIVSFIIIEAGSKKSVTSRYIFKVSFELKPFLTFYIFFYKPYFCGQYPECTILGSRWALNRALHNVEAFYPVVGVLEDMNSTLHVLQNKLPKFFRGVIRLYSDKLKGMLLT